MWMLRGCIVSLLTCLLLLSCKNWLLDSGRLSQSELSRVRECSFAPVIEQSPNLSRELSTLLSKADRLYKEKQYNESLLVLIEADSTVATMDGALSSWRLQILETQMAVSLAQGNLQAVDRLQHVYHGIVTANHAQSLDVIRDAVFRLGCWHYSFSSWHEAMFDFERVIDIIKSLPQRSIQDKKILAESERFANAASLNFYESEAGAEIVLP